MKLRILLNAKAGTLNAGTLENPQDIVRAAFERAGHQAGIELVEPEHMDTRLDDAARSDADAIVVGGGDGTFSHALAKLANSGKILGLIPLGTMNLLGRDMYAQTGDLSAMAEALAHGEVKKVDLATLNGRPFHTLAGLGYFARVAREREQTRFDFPGGKILSVLISIWRSVSKAGRTRLVITAGGRRISTRAYATMVTSNRIGEDWRRQKLDEGLLELHLMRAAHFTGRAKAGFELLSGNWRAGNTIESIAADRIEIASERPRIWVAVDGELRREETPLIFSIAPRKVSVLFPEA